MPQSRFGKIRLAVQASALLFTGLMNVGSVRGETLEFLHRHILSHVAPPPLSGPDFKREQLRYPRVRAASAEKLESVKKLFAARKLPFPPIRLLIRIFKADKQLELWSSASDAAGYQLVKTYPICSSSGKLGPKRQEGDLQVPEGFYFIDSFNPQSNFFLSMRVNYPNESDRILGVKGDLGGLIYIHGNCVTIGCVPITDDGIKELYLVAVEARAAGQTKIPVHIFPTRLDAAGMDRLAVLAKDSSDKETLLAFWKNLQPGYEYFEKNRLLPKVTVDKKGRYLFNTS
jgi:murein L,D-transpeptidase YafK